MSFQPAACLLRSASRRTKINVFFVVFSVSRAWLWQRCSQVRGDSWNFFCREDIIFPVMATPTSAVPNPGATFENKTQAGL